MDYLFACILMGAGIAIDVVLATLARVRILGLNRPGLSWLWKITFTHILFPVVGYYTAIYLVHLGPWMTPVVGVLAAGLLGWHLTSLVRDILVDSRSDEPSNEAGSTTSWGLVLAVSWDALFSGPAKSAQAIGWTEAQILWSFPIAGLVVSVGGGLALAAAELLRRGLDPRRVALSPPVMRAQALALLLEVGIFAYFMLLALIRLTLGFEPAVLTSAVGACLIAAATGITLWRPIQSAVANRFL
ncbi:hypothetical protein GVN21_13745 [Caulobacter sp. SLTY]|uniref:hypothetical protein n=1 Tax=Caulobacter sp. SLTY TaxID=2683262 RepID=UPI00141247A6|nr:hypothetical protein [Caulobacter sp. SLTY]NBB16424.1 hypothetical protein [Caulobacter sp. SLTY]